MYCTGGVSAPRVPVPPRDDGGGPGARSLHAAKPPPCCYPQHTQVRVCHLETKLSSFLLSAVLKAMTY